MTLFLCAILLICVVGLGFWVWELEKTNHRLYADLEQTELNLSAAQRRIEELETRNSKPETPLTAGEIAARAVKRLQLRRSASDEMAKQEEATRTQERKHIDIVRNIEAVSAQIAVRQKEKK